MYESILKATEYLKIYGLLSIPFLQRKLRLGYKESKLIMDQVMRK